MRSTSLISIVLSLMLSACGGGGGGSTTNVTASTAAGSTSGSGDTPAAPAPAPTVQPTKAASLSLSSYENKMAAINSIGPLSLTDTFGSALGNSFLHSNSLAYGDFFGDGNYALVAHSFEYDWTAATADKKGHIYFYRQANGKWIDNTSALIDDTSGCLHPRKAVVADFNQDGRPDVFFACTGIDQPPFSGEPSLLLLSNKAGKFTKHFYQSKSPNYTHGASAADINGDGYPDLVITDHGTYDGRGGIGFYINNRDGTFTFTNSLIPGIDLRKTAYTAELIKFPGRNAYDLFLSGHSSDPQYNQNPQIVINDGTGKFSSSVSFPSVPGYGLALDVIHHNGHAYLLRTIDTNPDFYRAVVIQKVKYPEMTSSEVIYTHTGSFPKANSTWVNWIGVWNGKIVAPDADYGLSISP